MKCFCAVFDSREERAAAGVGQSVWDHCSVPSTHNHNFVAISNKEQQNYFTTSNNFIKHTEYIKCNMLPGSSVLYNYSININ